MIADFARQMVDPPRARCIGVDLKPFSLGHLFILKQIGNAFVRNEFPTYNDLIAAAFVCAHTWEENQKILRTRFRKWLLMSVWGLLAGKFNVATQTIVLKMHVDGALEFPEQKKPTRGSSTRYLFSDDDTRLYSFLRTRMGHSEAMNFPLRMANLMWAAQLEELGHMDFKSQRDYNIEDRMIALLEEDERNEKGLSA